jgi:hypothetical protein
VPVGALKARREMPRAPRSSIKGCSAYAAARRGLSVSAWQSRRRHETGRIQTAASHCAGAQCLEADPRQS